MKRLHPTKPASERPRPPLWAEGRFSLLVRPPGDGLPSEVTIRRPYALVGGAAEADVRITDRRVARRHTYLHLDRRGLFAVDLATPTGTIVGVGRRSSGWLLVGEEIEVAGHRIELREIEVVGDGEGSGTDPLADAGSLPLVQVSLCPSQAPNAPVILGSELVFLGGSPNCGVRVEGRASPVHCVFVRNRSGAFVVDLIGRGTSLNGRPLSGASPLRDGDTLTIGDARFSARVYPPIPARRPTGHALATTLPSPAPPASSSTELLPTLPPLPPDLIPAEAQGAVLAWMMAALQEGQAELLRRQDDFQRDVVRLLGHMQQENSDAVDRHLDRVEAINRELSGLRDEVSRLARPDSPPIRSTPRPSPIPIPSPSIPANDSADSAQWLLSRVRQLDQENRSSWRDLLGRLGRPSR